MIGRNHMWQRYKYARAIFFWHGFTSHDLILITAQLRDHMHGKVLDETTHPFLNFNVCTVEI